VVAVPLFHDVSRPASSYVYDVVPAASAPEGADPSALYPQPVDPPDPEAG
jgi:hypothetical protein